MNFEGVFELLLDRARGSGVFKRNKKPLRVKVTSALIYQAGLSCRCVADLLSLDCEASYEAVRQWFHRLKQVLPKPQPRYRRTLAADETKLKLEGAQFYVWAAIDVKRKELIAYRVSWFRSSLDALIFLGEALKACTNKPLVLVDKGPWYPWALAQLGIRFRHVTFGTRNRIERWFGFLKARTKRFYNNFPHNSSLESVRSFLETFMGLYNMEQGF